MSQASPPRRKALLIVLSILVPVLFILGWSQASLNLSFIHPTNPSQTILLLALSTFIFLAFVIFALILSRTLLKLYVERRREQLGSRFKTKMVVAFLGLSLVPVCFLFAFAYGLLNRSIDRWFGVPFDVIRRDATAMVSQMEAQAAQRSSHIAAHLSANPDLLRALARGDRGTVEAVMGREVAGDLGTESALCFDRSGQLVAKSGDPQLEPAEIARSFPGILRGPLTSAGVTQRWQGPEAELYLAARPLPGPASGSPSLGTIVAISRLPLQLMRTSEEVQRQAQKYDELSRERKSVKRNYLSMLWLLTVVIMFIATWFALFLSKQVTIPIQALAEATHEVSKGNLGYQVAARADDELGILIQSFNEMTRQLLENRLAIEKAARELQEANRQLDERGKTMAAILENIPTAVISFDPQGQITRLNTTAERFFGQQTANRARTLNDLFSAEDALEIARLFRRASRQGVVTRQLQVDLGSRPTFAAITVSSIRSMHGPVGSVMVLEDLTDLLQAQKAAAWQEVAQRIAHEIKNPLTPIQLSTERIRRLIDRAGPDASVPDLLPSLVESSALIGREVATLKSLVDEFSEFARFPSSRPVPSSLNSIIDEALQVFEGRLDSVQLHRDFAEALPLVPADPAQIKRAVVNLIDNAAEALEHALNKEIWVRTALDADRDVVELVVADSGPGIPPEAKEKLFLPYFSTKRRGTGLGLAIVSRIVSEHNGSIRIEENQPTGTRFVIELPIERAPAEAAPS